MNSRNKIFKMKFVNIVLIIFAAYCISKSEAQADGESNSWDFFLVYLIIVLSEKNNFFNIGK